MARKRNELCNENRARRGRRTKPLVILQQNLGFVERPARAD
jgi:hypothetical protein